MRYIIQENCLTIYLPKEVDHFHVREIRIEADALIDKHHIKHIIFDFRDTRFMDSSGIGAIMGRYKLIYMLGGEVWAVNINEHIKKVLLMSGMDRIIQLYEGELEDECHQCNGVEIR